MEFDLKRQEAMQACGRQALQHGEEARAFARNVWVAIYVIAAIVVLFIILR